MINTIKRTSKVRALRGLCEDDGVVGAIGQREGEELGCCRYEREGI